jgi:hypothetical protein
MTGLHCGQVPVPAGGYDSDRRFKQLEVMPLTLEALEVVDTIARKGSFAAAAAELGRVPSALTYTVRKLQDAPELLLFDRRGRRASLTAAGRELLDPSQPVASTTPAQPMSG